MFTQPVLFSEMSVSLTTVVGYAALAMIIALVFFFAVNESRTRFAVGRRRVTALSRT